MSIWISASGSPNIKSAKFRARYVFPTPVGPRKRKEPIGRFGSFRSARERRSALEIAITASSWPITRLFSSSSIFSSFSVSFCSIRCSGTPVHFETTAMISSSSTTTIFSSELARHAFSVSSSSFFAFFSSSRSAAAFSKSCSEIAATFCRLIDSIRFSASLIDGGRVIVPIRARAPASSSTSIALSGRKRAVR